MKHTKNLVGKRGKRLSAVTKKNFGIDEMLIKSALTGDTEALKQIGAMGKEGRMISQLMPIIKDNSLAFIQGTQEYNQGIAEIYKAGSRASIAIDKAGDSLLLENQRYGHERTEMALDLKVKRGLENQRHVENMDMIKLKAFIDYHMSQVDQKASLEAISARPMQAQLAANQSYEVEKAKHLLTNGNESDLSLIPQKNYSTNPVVKFFQAIRGITS